MIGIVGGTHLLKTNILERRREIEIQTPFGVAEIDLGNIDNVAVAIIQRHGRKKDKPPHRINHPANFYALKSLGVTKVIAMGSAGCLREEIEIPSIIVPHDYIDLFSGATVFNNSLVYVTPGFDEELRKILLSVAKRISNLPVIEKGVYFQTRGPRLETRAEIAMIKNFADCVGMTAGSEATVAKELGLRYAIICTMDNYAHGIKGAKVDYEEIIKRANENANNCVEIVKEAVKIVAKEEK